MRRAAAVLALAAGLSSCSHEVKQPLPPGHVEPAREAEVPRDANFTLAVSEAVAGPEEDTGSYVRVYVDGQAQGQTPVGPRSQERRWAVRLPPGNHLFRFEQWLLPAVGDWAPLDAQWQPPERFIRVQDKARTTAVLKFTDGGRRHLIKIERETL